MLFERILHFFGVHSFQYSATQFGAEWHERRTCRLCVFEETKFNNTWARTYDKLKGIN